MKKLSLKARCALVVMLVVGLSVPALANPGVEVVPLEHNFGDVELGISYSTIITITNDWFDTLIIDIGFQPGSSPDFSIVTEPLPDTIGPFESVDIQVTFTPSAIGFVEAALIVDWANGGTGIEYVSLMGNGVEPTGDPVTIQDILDFFDDSAVGGSLIGNGSGNSADGRRNAFRNMLEAVSDLLAGGLTEDACQQLRDAYDRCDGIIPPSDFVAGPAAPVLAGMILDLMGQLGCQ
jgi:hypothetical protein